MSNGRNESFVSQTFLNQRPLWVFRAETYGVVGLRRQSLSL